MRLLRFVAGFVCVSACMQAQTTGATFGDVIKLGSTPSDVVLDESRGRLYLVNSAANRVDVYSYTQNTIIGSIKVGTLPFAAAMSMDSAYLYVTNNTSSTLSVIDLGSGIGSLSASISLPAKPEGVEVGNDGRVLISTQGTGTNTTTPQNVLLIYDPLQNSGAQVQSVNFPPLPTTPAVLPQLQTTRPTTTFRGKLLRTPDGTLIVGVNNLNAGTTNTLVYVYEVASGTVLRSRASVGQSTALSMSPDGSRFMAGFTMFDTGTLGVIGQMDYRNAPYAQATAFNTIANVGGSIFSPDGATLYAAYNIAAGTPLPKPSASTMMVADPSNLSIKLGIKVPESIVAKLVATADGSNAWASSESGLVHLPLSTLYDYPILMPDSTAVFLAQDDCNRGIASSPVKINNIGKGKLTFSVPTTGTALAASVNTGVAPATMTLTMDPGRVTTTMRQPGTNLYTNSNGIAYPINLVSPEAINVPPTILVYMNYRQSDQRGQVFPIAVSPNGANSEGLRDLVLDEKRQRLYVSNAGKNQIEVFDTVNQQLLTPLPAGQLPGPLAMGTDGDSLYVANTGGESIQLIDLNSGTIAATVAFPPVPRAATATTNYAVLAMANGLSGLQVIMSNGTQWQVIGNTAIPRQVSSVINSTSTNPSTTMQTPLTLAGLTMISTPDYTQALVLAGNYVYLYDALTDEYIGLRQLYSSGIQSYYGPLAASPGGAFYMTNGLILNSSLSVLGGTTSPIVPPISTTVSVTTNRNVAAVAQVNDHQFLRLTTPLRQGPTSPGTDDSRATLSLIDLNLNSESLIGPMPENPAFSDFGTTPARTNVPARQMAVDSQGTVYIITLSGLTIVPMTTGSNTTPTLNNQAIVNATDGTNIVRPGSFITINGQSLASTAAPAGLTAPTRLGGTCVTFSDVAIPLLRTTPTQISGQLPPDMRPGLYVAQVRSLANAQQSTPIVVTVAPAQ